MDKTYSPKKFLVAYWTDKGYIISIVDTEHYDQTNVFFAESPQTATAAIECKMEELRESKA